MRHAFDTDIITTQPDVRADESQYIVRSRRTGQRPDGMGNDTRRSTPPARMHDSHSGP